MVGEPPIAALRALVDVCRDSEQLYRSALDRITSPDAAALFEQQLQQRRRYVDELIDALRRLGQEPEHAGTVASPLKQENVGVADSGRADDAIAGELITNEAAAVIAYENALKSGLPEDAHSLVRKQHQGVKEAYDRLSGLGLTS